MLAGTGLLCTTEELATPQKEDTGLSSLWLGCVSRCLERLQYLYNRNTKLQTPRSRRAKSTYNAVCASVMPSISPRKGTSAFTGLAVGSASRKGQWGLRLWHSGKVPLILESRDCVGPSSQTYTTKESSRLWCRHGSPSWWCFCMCLP